MRQKKYIFILFILFQLLSCKTSEEKTDVCFRARIINAKADEVLLSKNLLFIESDTLLIKNENEIKGKFHITEEGLYFIYIYPEFQTIYLKPGDSLACHINTEEFDESLSFSGSLGFENNLLMELYLKNEQESNYFYKANFQFQPTDFLKKIDSFEYIKKNLLKNYQVELKNTSEKFRKILYLWQKSLQYDLKESYLLKHSTEKLPKDYTKYRKILRKKMPDPNIIYMYAFVDNYIKSKLNNNKIINTPAELYKQIGIIISQEIIDEKFKDNLLTKYCYKYIKENRIVKNDSTIEYFFNNINNTSFKKYCNHYIKKNKILQTGKKFYSLKLLNKHKKKILSDSLFKNKTLLSFWDLKKRKNFISNYNKLKKLQKKFPTLEIIIFNINYDAYDDWLLQLPNDNKFKFYQIIKKNDKEKVTPYHMAQFFLLENDTIKYSLLNMYTVEAENIIRDFLYKEN